MYDISGHILQETCAKYLGISISLDLDWIDHASITAQKENIAIAFLRRKLKAYQEKLKEPAYFTLVRALEYDWNPIKWDCHQRQSGLPLHM